MRGEGKVIFKKKKMKGMLFIEEIVWGEINVGKIEIEIGQVIEILVEKRIEMMMGGERIQMRKGMLGLKGMIVGDEVKEIIEKRKEMWLIIVIGEEVQKVVMIEV